jgi:hypothetical protein
LVGTAGMYKHNYINGSTNAKPKFSVQVEVKKVIEGTIKGITD